MADFLSNSSLTVITGIAAGVLTATSMMPQVFKTMKTNKEGRKCISAHADYFDQWCHALDSLWRFKKRYTDHLHQ